MKNSFPKRDKRKSTHTHTQKQHNGIAMSMPSSQISVLEKGFAHISETVFSNR